MSYTRPRHSSPRRAASISAQTTLRGVAEDEHMFAELDGAAASSSSSSRPARGDNIFKMPPLRSPNPQASSMVGSGRGGSSRRTSPPKRASRMGHRVPGQPPPAAVPPGATHSHERFDEFGATTETGDGQDGDDWDDEAAEPREPAVASESAAVHSPRGRARRGRSGAAAGSSRTGKPSRSDALLSATSIATLLRNYGSAAAASAAAMDHLKAARVELGTLDRIEVGGKTFDAASLAHSNHKSARSFLKIAMMADVLEHARSGADTRLGSATAIAQRLKDAKKNGDALLKGFQKLARDSIIRQTFNHVWNEKGATSSGTGEQTHQNAIPQVLTLAAHDATVATWAEAMSCTLRQGAIEQFLESNKTSRESLGYAASRALYTTSVRLTGGSQARLKFPGADKPLIAILSRDEFPGGPAPAASSARTLIAHPAPPRSQGATAAPDARQSRRRPSDVGSSASSDRVDSDASSPASPALSPATKRHHLRHGLADSLPNDSDDDDEGLHADQPLSGGPKPRMVQEDDASVVSSAALANRSPHRTTEPSIPEGARLQATSITAVARDVAPAGVAASCGSSSASHSSSGHSSRVGRSGAAIHPSVFGPSDYTASPASTCSSSSSAVAGRAWTERINRIRSELISFAHAVAPFLARQAESATLGPLVAAITGLLRSIDQVDANQLDSLELALRMCADSWPVASRALAPPGWLIEVLLAAIRPK